MKYHQRIRELRLDNDKSQKEIAQLLETTQSYYSQYELGKRQMPVEHIMKLCVFYGVSADYILGLPKDLKYPDR